MTGFDRFGPDIESEAAATLLERLKEVRTIDEAILRERTRGSILVRSCSAGKPWFLYDELIEPCERLRVRAVEKWLQYGPRMHGTVLVLIQSVFSRQENELGLVRGDKNTVVLESSTDERVSAQYRLRFRSNGSVYGGLLTRGDENSPFYDGAPSTQGTDMADFYWQQLDLEADYKRSTVTSDDVVRLNTELADFIDEERALASYRAVIRL